jgi:hypothetical protein
VRFCIDAQQTFFPTTGRYHLVLPLELELFLLSLPCARTRRLPCVFRRRTTKYFKKSWFSSLFLFLHYNNIIL